MYTSRDISCRLCLASLGLVTSVRSSVKDTPSSVTLWSPRLSRSRPLDIAVFPLPPNLDASSAVNPVGVVVDGSGAVCTLTAFGDRAVVRLPKTGPQEACVAVGAFWRRNIVFVGTASGGIEVYAWHSGVMRWLLVGHVAAPHGTTPVPPAATSSTASAPVVLPGEAKSYTWTLLDIVEEVLLKSGHVRFVVCGVLQAKVEGNGSTGPLGTAHVSLSNVTVGRVGAEGPVGVSIATQPVFTYAVDWPSQKGAPVVAASVVKLPSTVSDLLRNGDVFQGAGTATATPVTPVAPATPAATTPGQCSPVGRRASHPLLGPCL